MICNGFGKIAIAATAAVTLATTLTLTASAQAGHFKGLHEFKGGGDGITPVAGLIEDANGNLYGTTISGGLLNANNCNESGCGTVFELSPATGGGWVKTTLHRFTGNRDGGAPTGALVMDESGNLFGTTENGGSQLCGTPGCGVVYELSPTSSSPWTLTVIYSFPDSSAGARPNGLVRDASGNLYGSTTNGGTDWGVVYALSQSSGSWVETVLHAFSNTDGSLPNSTLYMDGSGNLFGTTLQGGVLTGNCKTFGGCGTVFELSPASGGGWNFANYAFPTPTQGIFPVGAVREDASGNLYGVTSAGGINSGGVAFKLVPVSGGGWTESVFHTFDLAKGSSPVGLIEDGKGGYYGAAQSGGNTSCNGGCGTVFDLTPTSSGGWVATTLHSFTGVGDGGLPNPLMVDANGNIFGTAEAGGRTNCAFGGCGTAFEITNPGALKK